MEHNLNIMFFIKYLKGAFTFLSSVHQKYLYMLHFPFPFFPFLFFVSVCESHAVSE